MKKEKITISEERRCGDLLDMRSFLQPLARKMLGKRAFAEADVLCNWKEIVGEDVAEFATPQKLVFKSGERTNGTLWVETRGGAFALELQLRTPIILNKVNVFLGYSAVNNLKIVQNPETKFEDNSTLHNKKKKLVTEEEENYIRSLSGAVEDAGLQDALEALGRAVIANNKKW